MHEYIIPTLLAICAVLTLRKKENAYDLLTEGAAEGLQLMKTITPR